MIPARVSAASHFSGCVKQSFALSLNDLPIDSGDKLKPLFGVVPGLKLHVLFNPTQGVSQ
jgi:hypothetical protein